MPELRKCSFCGKMKPYVMVSGKVFCLDCAKENGHTQRGDSFRFLSIISAIILLFFLFLANTSDDNAKSSRRDTTSDPQATSTPAWDDPVAWALYAVQQNIPKSMSLDTVETSASAGEVYLTVACNMDTMWDGDDYITAASDLICDVIPLIRGKQGFDHVTFLFYGPFVDKYGNKAQELGIRAMYSRDTLQKVNVEYFSRYTRAIPDGVIKAADTHLIHPAYNP